MATARGSFAKYISIISLLFSFTNYIPISAAISGLALLLYPFNFAANRTSRVVTPLLFLFIFTVLSTVMYNASSLFSYEFYRRDGNFFITMTPLLFLASSMFYVNLDRTLKWFVYISTAANFAALSLWLATGVAVLRQIAIGESTTELYYFMFAAHNAAGGFLAVLCAYSFAIFLDRRNFLNGLILTINVAALIFTNSRGSMIGFFVAIILVYFIPSRFKDRFYTIISSALAINIVVVLYTYYNSDIVTIMNQQAFVTNFLQNLSPGIAAAVDANISNRMDVLWPLAMHAFLQSPIFGIGFGAYDDTPWRLVGWTGVFAMNDSYRIIHSDAHAHNTYLNVMAETGAVGLVLLLWSLNRLFHYIYDLPASMIRQALLVSFWACVVASFTEHRLFTPAQMLPFVIMVGMTIAHHRYLTETTAAALMKLKPALAGLPQHD